MIVFVFMAIKVIATLFSISDPSLISFSAPSVPMLIVWATDHSATELFAPKSVFCAVLLIIYFLVWIIAPWMAISNRKVISVVGLAVVIGTNFLDVMGCILSSHTISIKALGLLFCVVIILLSIMKLRRWNSIA